MDAETKAELRRINEKLSLLIKQSQQKSWVKSTVITDLTGWNGEKMRQAREHGLIEFKTEKDGERTTYWYNLDSLHTALIIKKASA